MKPFLLFLWYTLVTSVYSFVLCVVEFIRCEVVNSNECRANNTNENSILILNFSVTGFFAFFTLTMGFLCLAVLVTQIGRINDNLGLIDRLQFYDRTEQIEDERRLLKKVIQKLNQVSGSTNSRQSEYFQS